MRSQQGWQGTTAQSPLKGSHQTGLSRCWRARGGLPQHPWPSLPQTPATHMHSHAGWEGCTRAGMPDSSCGDGAMAAILQHEPTSLALQVGRRVQAGHTTIMRVWNPAGTCPAALVPSPWSTPPQQWYSTCSWSCLGSCLECCLNRCREASLAESSQPHTCTCSVSALQKLLQARVLLDLGSDTRAVVCLACSAWAVEGLESLACQTSCGCCC